jgi:DNA-binding transcriptional MerR regulator
MGREAGYTIRTMAVRCGMTVHTLRFYERIGLIHPVSRERNGHRRYSDADEAWLKFLHWLRATHMPIREMLRYAALRGMETESAQDQRGILEDHRVALDRQIESLQEARALLTYNIECLRKVEDGRAVAPFVPYTSWNSETITTSN